MDQLDEKTNESHDQKPDSGGTSDGGKFFTIWLGAFFDQVDGILRELTEWLDENFVKSFFLSHGCVTVTNVVSVALYITEECQIKGESRCQRSEKNMKEGVSAE